MKIAYLGWGSLIWNPESLPITGDWMLGGPVLPVEFSRISGDGRLTLVIDLVDGIPVETHYANCSEAEISTAINQLRVREGNTLRKHIGHVNLTVGSAYQNQSPCHESIVEWGRKHKFDAVIWTALPPNFIDKIYIPYSVNNALAYLGKLSGSTREKALEYIQKAPVGVQTPFRMRFNEVWKG